MQVMELIHIDISTFSGVLLMLVVWAVVYVETGLLVGFLLPGDSLLFTAGLLAARPDGVSVWVLVTGIVIAAIAGDQTGYWLGKRLGRPYLAKKGERIQAGMRRAEAFYDKYGWFSVIAARFIPWARTFVPFAAGAAHMSRAMFSLANAVGALCWGAGVTLVGYFAYQITWLRTLAFIVAGTVVVGTFVVAGAQLVRTWVKRRTRRPQVAAQPAVPDETL